ncbi:MAG: transglutaminase domain-containing protein [Spirochaetales bacterium]|nr:transglutaminase domain-containing protein [Spirochaetales bacterium]
MGKNFFLLFSLALFMCFGCELFENNIQPSIALFYNGEPVSYYINVADDADFELTIEARDSDGSITDVYLNIDTTSLDISDNDTDVDPSVYKTDYRFLSSSRGNFSEFSIVVKDDMAGISERIINIDNTDYYGIPKNDLFDVVIPEIKIQDGGLSYRYTPSGQVIYCNPSGKKSESDIRLDEPLYYSMHAKRYLNVAGLAVPDDSGYDDRDYHAVIFSIVKDSTLHFYTFPVNIDRRFSGYLYFPETGLYTVYAYRMWNNHLYPYTRGTQYKVDEGAPTLRFTVQVDEAVPRAFHHLLPTRDVDCGTKYVRDYAEFLSEGCRTDFEKVKTIYEFLIYGNGGRPFEYYYYDEIYPGYLDRSYVDVFIASHFLIQRLGVCNDFAETFAALTRSLGFKVQKVTGFVPDGSGHMWNRILLDDRWYRVDATFGNCTGSYKTFAEFYPEFDASYFEDTHEKRYTEDFTQEY